MKKVVLKNFVFFLLMCMLVASCSSSESSKEEFIREFYTECVFGVNPECRKILVENSSECLLKCLRDGYG